MFCKNIDAKRYKPPVLDLKNRNSSHTLIVELTGCNKTVLEVGTSTGYLSKILKEQGNRVVGVEVDAAAAATAAQYCDQMITGDVELLELDNYFAPNYFDVIIFGDVLEHLQWPHLVLEKVKRYLKPDGHLVVSLPNIAHGDIILNLLLGKFGYTNVGLLDITHLRFFGLGDIIKIFGDNGYQISDLQTTEIEVGATEAKIDLNSVPKEVLETIKALPHAQTYQFVFRAYLKEYGYAHPISLPKANLIEAFHQVKDSYITHLEDMARENSAALSQRDAIISEIRTVIKEKESEAGGLRAGFAEKESALNSIYSSRGWKALTIYYRVRDKIFPINTKRRSFAKLVFRIITNPKKTLRNLNKTNLKNFIYYFKTSEAGGIRRTTRCDTGAMEKEGWRPHQGITADDSEKNTGEKVQHNLKIIRDCFNLLFETKTQKSKDYVSISYPNIPETDIKLIAFYLTQFHPIPENDEWWGEGFTEWTNVSKAVPNFLGHYQPHMPGELGFYDLRLTEVQRRQVELARQYGIYGFCFYYYWFQGKRLLERPLNQFFEDPEIDFPFCLCWANENWTRRWDGKENEILIAQAHSEDEYLAFIRDIIPNFLDNKYIRVNGKPLLIVYRVSLLPNPRLAVDIWRSECKKMGIDDIYLVAAQSSGTTDPRPYGFDAAVEFPPHNLGHTWIDQNRVKIINPNFRGIISDYGKAVQSMIEMSAPDYTLFRTVMPSWDNTARKQNDGYVFINSTPSAYKTWLAHDVRYTRRFLPKDKRFIFINAWNEWAEGTHLEPDKLYGYAYLQATAEAIES